MPPEINYFLIESSTDNTATWIAIASALISLGAFAVAAVQTSITRNHNRISVKPHIAIDTDEADNIFIATLKNSGFGPAKIVDAKLYIDGKHHPGHGTSLIESAFELIKDCQLINSGFFDIPYVMPTNESVKLFEIKFNETKIPDCYNYIRSRIRIDIKYECFYGTPHFYTSNPGEAASSNIEDAH